MTKLTILVDMDDVLVNLVECWVEELNATHGSSVTLEDVDTWNIAEVFPHLTKEEVFSPLFDDTFWLKLSAKPDAAERLVALIGDGHKIRVVTASFYQTLPAKMALLFREFPFLSWSDVIVTQDKQMICGDVLIDDAIHNLKGGSYAKFLFTRPYNALYNADANGMTRVYNWADIYYKIQEMAGGVE